MLADGVSLLDVRLAVCGAHGAERVPDGPITPAVLFRDERRCGFCDVAVVVRMVVWLGKQMGSILFNVVLLCLSSYLPSSAASPMYCCAECVGKPSVCCGIILSGFLLS